MPFPTVDVCVGPLDPLCQAVDGAAGSVGDAASDAVLGGLGSAFVSAADEVSATALAALDSTTRIDLTASWFQQNVAVIAAVTLPAVVGLFVLQVIASVLRREPGGLGRAVLGVGKAMLGSAIAIAATQTALLATDQICEFIAASAGTTVVGAASQFLDLTWLAGPTAGPVLQILLGLAMIVGFLLMWAVLLFRKAALMLVAVFAPIAFAGSVWDHTRIWTRRWIEVVVALVFCKVVIVVVFVVGASAFSGVGPSVPGSDATAVAAKPAASLVGSTRRTPPSHHRSVCALVDVAIRPLVRDGSGRSDARGCDCWSPPQRDSRVGFAGQVHGAICRHHDGSGRCWCSCWWWRCCRVWGCGGSGGCRNSRRRAAWRRPSGWSRRRRVGSVHPLGAQPAVVDRPDRRGRRRGPVMNSVTTATVRFGRLERRGVLLGLSAGQLAALAGGLVVLVAAEYTAGAVGRAGQRPGVGDVGGPRADRSRWTTAGGLAADRRGLDIATRTASDCARRPAPACTVIAGA